MSSGSWFANPVMWYTVVQSRGHEDNSNYRWSSRVVRVLAQRLSLSILVTRPIQVLCTVLIIYAQAPVGCRKCRPTSWVSTNTPLVLSVQKQSNCFCREMLILRIWFVKMKWPTCFKHRRYLSVRGTGFSPARDCSAKVVSLDGRDIGIVVFTTSRTPRFS